MKKDHNLYFIPLLAEAFDQEDRTAALRAAIQEIIQLGDRPEYRKGFEQFLSFLAVGREQSLDKDDLDSIKSDILQIIISNSETDRLIEELLHKMGAEPGLALELYRDKELLETRPAPTKGNEAVFKNITPGDYTIKFSNGRVIWQGTITTKDVVWKSAFPDKDYKMVAAIEKEEPDCTKSVRILDGEMSLAIHAGLETGRISIVFLKD